MGAINLNNIGAGNGVELQAVNGILQDINGNVIPYRSIANTWTKQQTFDGDTTGHGANFRSVIEKISVSASGAGGSLNFYTLTGPLVYFYTAVATSNWSVNLSGSLSPSVSLASVLPINGSMTFVLMAQQGTPAYYPVAHLLDGSAITPKWQGGTAPTSGNPGFIDVYTYTLLKTGSSSYTLLASQTKFL